MLLISNPDDDTGIYIDIILPDDREVDTDEIVIALSAMVERLLIKTYGARATAELFRQAAGRAATCANASRHE